MPRPSPQTERVVTLVSLLAAHPDEPWTLAAITRRLDLNKSTVHSMLAALHRAGWLLRDPIRKTYRLGPALGDVGRSAEAGFPALEFATSTISELAARFDTAGAVLLASDRSIVVGHVVPARTGQPGPRLGASIPLRAPFGAAIVAWSDPAAVEEWMSHVRADDRANYAKALDTVRERRWAVELTPDAGERVDQLLTQLRDRSEEASPSVTLEVLERVADSLAHDTDQLADELHPDVEYSVSAINAPVFDDEGHVSLVLSLLTFDGPRSGDAIVHIGQALSESAQMLTTALGHHA